jgi:hypothetical protein
VATDQKTKIVNIEPGSVIENELPTYRAISVQAVFSLVCGALAIFCFGHPFFYVAAILAVMFGFLAHRTIRQYPDMFTGRGLANAGIAMGLVFGLGTATYTTVQWYVRTSQAEKFGRRYAEILKSPRLGDFLQYSLHPDGRKDEQKDEFVKRFETAQPKEKMMIETKYGQTLALRKRLQSSKDEHVEFVRIEAVGEDEGQGGEIPIFAFALYEVHGPGSKEFPEKQQYALAILKGRLKGKQYDWWVEDVRYPYTPQSYLPVAKAPDDGHGHAH